MQILGISLSEITDICGAKHKGDSKLATFAIRGVMKPSFAGSNVSVAVDVGTTPSVETPGTVSVSVGSLPIFTFLTISLERTGTVGSCFREPLSSVERLLFRIAASLTSTAGADTSKLASVFGSMSNSEKRLLRGIPASTSTDMVRLIPSGPLWAKARGGTYWCSVVNEDGIQQGS